MLRQLVKNAIAKEFLEVSENALLAFLDVESGGKGFAGDGRLIIQFEPHYFRKRCPSAPDGVWAGNKVEGQAKEWLAFNDAQAISREYAIESTSLGLPQIMGAHWLRLGYRSASDMWRDFHMGEQEQVNALARFIKTDKRLLQAIQALNWDRVATIYNGAAYKQIALKYGGDTYDVRMAKAYEKRTKEA